MNQDSPAWQRIVSAAESILKHRGFGVDAHGEAMSLVNDTYVVLGQHGQGKEMTEEHQIRLFIAAMNNQAKKRQRKSIVRSRQISIELALDLPGYDEAPGDQLTPILNGLFEIKEKGRIYQCIWHHRIEGGLSHQEIGELLGISQQHVYRHWRFMKTWIRAGLDT